MTWTDNAAISTNANPRLAFPAGEGVNLSNIPEAEWTEVAGGRLHAVRRDMSHGHVRLRSYVIDAPAAQRGDSLYDGIFSHTIDERKITEHMDVIASDGEKLGTVQHLDGPDRMRLAKHATGDKHHYISLGIVASVDEHVRLGKSAAEVKAIW